MLGKLLCKLFCLVYKNSYAKMSGVERWELGASCQVRHRQKDRIGNMVWAQTGLGIA